MTITIGIIGGSGLYDMAELTDREERRITTPFGDPSGAVCASATLRGQRVAFLARHGAGHRLMPTELNYRANVFGFKMLGVEWILSASAVGSLQEEYEPPDLVFPDQFFDRTQRPRQHVLRRRASSRTSASRIRSAQRSPTSPPTSAAAAGATVHRGGTYVCMEGPQFSTLAESKLYRSWGVDIIGMTNLQEAKLAREAEICYATHRAGHRLRLLASRPRLGHRRHDRRQPDAEREDGAAGHRATPSTRLPTRAPASARGAAARHHHPPRRHSRRDASGSLRRSSGST